MKVSSYKEFTIFGDLRIDARSYDLDSGNKAAQVLCFADVLYDQREFQNILLLSLNIEGSQNDGWEVMEEFPFSLFPYMKPVKAFREFLAKSFFQYRENLPEAEQRSPWSPLWMGIGVYITDHLNAYDETRDLLSQVRREVEKLQRQQRNHRSFSSEQKQSMRDLAQSLLKVLGSQPRTEQPFSVREAY